MSCSETNSNINANNISKKILDLLDVYNQIDNCDNNKYSI